MFSETRYARNGDLRVAYRAWGCGGTTARVPAAAVDRYHPSAGGLVGSGSACGVQVGRPDCGGAQRPGLAGRSVANAAHGHGSAEDSGLVFMAGYPVRDIGGFDDFPLGDYAFTDAAAPEFAATMAAMTHRKRATTLVELAEAAAFVASDRAAAMTGTVANLTGGIIVD